MTIKGGTSQACAACKYQRRRCSKDCILAPYFPADKPKMFQNAHRLFGVCNITKILKQVHPNQKEDAMRSIKYESNMRANFPVFGCSSVIWQLEFQLKQAMEELRYLNTRLAMCKDQCYYQIPTSPSSSSQLQLGISMNNNNNNNNNNNAVPVYQNHQLGSATMAMAPMSPNDYLVNGNSNGVYVESPSDEMMMMMKTSRCNQSQYSYYNNNNNMQIQSHQMMMPQGFPMQQETEVSHNYDDLPFDTIADDRQSYIESRDACESSAESTLKDTATLTQTHSIEHVMDNELRTAAARLSLTGVR